MKRIMLLATILVITASVVSCAPEVVKETVVVERTVEKVVKETVVVEKPVEVTTVEWWTQPRAEYDAIIDELFVDTFHASQPGIRLKLLRREEHEDVVRIALQARLGPDIIQTNGPCEVTDIANAGLLMPLNEYAAQYGWADKLMPWAYESGFVGDQLYCLPLTYESMVLFYNQQLFDENGWEPPKTLEDMEFLCSEADRLGKVCVGSSTTGRATRNGWWLMWVINSAAGPDKVYKALTGEIPWTDQAFADAVELQRSWIADKGWFAGNLDNYFSLSHDDNWAAMTAGDTLMRVSGSWELRRLRPFCPDHCGWAIPPSLNESVPQHFLLAVGETVSISAFSENPDAAAKVIDHLFNDRERAAKLVEDMGFSQWTIPFSWQTSDFSADAEPTLVRFLKEFGDVTGEGNLGYTNYTFLPAETNLYLCEGFDLVLVGDITVEEYLQTLQDTFEAEMASTPRTPETGISQ